MYSKEQIEKFESRLAPEPNTGCFLWEGGNNHRGYGQVWINGKFERSHRFAWMIKFGPIPKGLQILHKCDTPACSNIDHLFIGTQSENIKDCVRKHRWKNNLPAESQETKSHCYRGHPYSGDNLYITPKGKRQCRECARMHDLQYRIARKEKNPVYAKSHCLRGHAFSGSNLYLDPKGSRKCRACRAIRKERYKNKNQEVV